MTTGSDVLDGEANTDPNLIFKQGAGHVQPTSAADPGLVYESGVDDWTAFLCGSTRSVADAACDDLEAGGRSLDPSDLNTPSIGIGLLDGTQTVTRTVKNVDDEAATYTATVSGLAGVGVTVEPSTLTVASGATAPCACRRSTRAGRRGSRTAASPRRRRTSPCTTRSRPMPP